MAVQINEVIVRAVVDPTPSSSSGSQVECNNPGGSESDTDLMERLLEIIREKQER